MWFRRKVTPTPPTTPIRYPDGLAVRTEGAVYLITGGKRYRFFSERCFSTWNLEPVVGSTISLSKFPSGGVLGFRDGTLICNYADGKVYFISKNKRRHLKSPDIIPNLGLSEDKVLKVSDAEANLHEDGVDIDGVT